MTDSIREEVFGISELLRSIVLIYVDGVPDDEEITEARYQIRNKIGIAAFMDGGSVSTSEVPSFGDLRLGAGLGNPKLRPSSSDAKEASWKAP